MTRFKAASLLVLALAVAGCIAGCIDDRARVAKEIFTCTPSSRTADADCGEGYFCYGEAQSVGESICVQRCGPGVSRACDGVCTTAGACLTRCTVPASGAPDPCPSPLLCRRTTDSPITAAAGQDGVCMPLSSTCAVSSDCSQGVFNECTSDVDGALQGPRLLTTGEFCVQGQCSVLGISCEPGSACIRDILPGSIPAPDICSPLCSSSRSVPDGGAFNECLPGMTCLSDAFPQIDAPACAPGFANWLCIDDIGCTAGKCYDWNDVAPELSGFKTCAADCKTDNDCIPYDRGGNPNVSSRNTCHDGVCRNLQAYYFPLTCLREGDRCQIDFDPNPLSCIPLTGATTTDMGDPTASVCGGGDPTVMGLGAFGGSALTCTRECAATSDCADIETKLHVPMNCPPLSASAPLGTKRYCLPVVPYKTACDPASPGDCFGNLKCLPDLDQPGTNVCTISCMTSDDCTQEPTLGSTFTCASGECVPKIPAGCAATNADSCISGQLAGGNCVSPLDWACTADAQCASGHCLLIDGTSPQFGRCE